MNNNQHKSTLSFQSASKSYVDQTKTTIIIKNLSLTFEQDQKYVITGASGIGKTTLLHILAGFESPSSGQIMFNDRNIAHFNETELNRYRQKSIGVIFQRHYLISELTVLENIALAAEIRGESKTEATKKARHYLAYVKLTDEAERYPDTLSGGQQQRVAVARALINQPQFLIADEPTGNLDEENSKNLIDLLDNAQQDFETGLIISTHDLSIIRKGSHHYHLESGELIKVSN